MKPVLLIAGAALAFILLSSAKGKSGYFNLAELDEDQDDINRLQMLQSELSSRGLSRLQIQLLLSQALHETGLFTNAANYKAVDQYHNYAGISPGGKLGQYDSISDFVDHWLTILDYDKGAGSPIDATSVADFNNRIKTNGYYTDNKSTYGNALQKYFDLLDNL